MPVCRLQLLKNYAVESRGVTGAGARRPEVDESWTGRLGFQFSNRPLGDWACLRGCDGSSALPNANSIQPTPSISEKKNLEKDSGFFGTRSSNLHDLHSNR